MCMSALFIQHIYIYICVHIHIELFFESLSQVSFFVSGLLMTHEVYCLLGGNSGLVSGLVFGPWTQRSNHRFAVTCTWGKSMVKPKRT